MNNKRRAEIAKICNRLEMIKDDITSVLDDEIDTRDNIPENLQGTERYDIACESVDILEDGLCSIEEALDSLSSIV